MTRPDRRTGCAPPADATRVLPTVWRGLPPQHRLRSDRRQHRAVLGEPRTVARFLCGIKSPALTRAKLTRHPLFGATAEADFGDVLARIEASSA